LKEPKDKPKKKLNNLFGAYAHYSGMALQMAAIIGVGTFIGYQIDAHYKTEKPLFTAGFSLLSVLVAIFVVIRQLLSNSKKK
jgi:F0F1-type ATP synthase assembly protein I